MKIVAGSMLFLIAMVILISLGSWQFQRGLEKADIDRRLQDGQVTERLERAPGSWADLEYRQADLVGEWRPERIFLLENRIHQGVPGYEVLVPFQLSGDGTVMLVNRGWVPAESAIAGDLDTGGSQSPSGVLYQPKPGFTLGDTLSGDTVWPQTVLYLDIPALSQRLGMPLAPAILVLNPDHADAFQQLWQPTSIPASRHYGYAVQWWGLALTLLVFGVIWWRRSKTSSNL